jgi:hypothetical protein
LELRREQDDPRELGAAFSRLAAVAWRRGDFDAAIGYHSQALPLFERAGDEGSRLQELHFLGESHRDRGDFDEGERLLEETAALARGQGRDKHLASTLHSLGDLALDRADPDTRSNALPKRSCPRLRRVVAAYRFIASRESRAPDYSRETTVGLHASGGSPRTRSAGWASG